MAEKEFDFYNVTPVGGGVEEICLKINQDPEEFWLNFNRILAIDKDRYPNKHALFSGVCDRIANDSGEQIREAFYALKNRFGRS